MTVLDHAAIRDIAREHGLPIVGFAAAAPVVTHPAFVEWLEAGYAGEMRWLERDAGPRADPRRLLESCKTVLLVALSYAHDDGIVPADRLLGTLARYARGADYHVVLKRRLQRLGTALDAAAGRAIERLICVDTAPLLERALAQQSGMGFVGKSAMLITPGVGSYLSLGAMLVDLELAPEPAMMQKCGTCRLCLDACPTGAFVGPFVIDARRCVSYLTIENRGPIPRELRPGIGDRIFGCDVCQEVCPFNAAGPRSGDPELAPRDGYARPDLLRLMRIGAAQFRKWQQKSSLRRIHRNELLRNVAVALGNAGDARALDALEDALHEPSALVREHVVWALGRIGGARAMETLRAHRAVETDATVNAELALWLREPE